MIAMSSILVGVRDAMVAMSSLLVFVREAMVAMQCHLYLFVSGMLW